jgi:hypothetical protein
MVESFQDTSFYGEKGKFYIAPSQFGLHIIEILEQGKKTKVFRYNILLRILPILKKLERLFIKKRLHLHLKIVRRTIFSGNCCNNAYSKRYC